MQSSSRLLFDLFLKFSSKAYFEFFVSILIILNPTIFCLTPLNHIFFYLQQLNVLNIISKFHYLKLKIIKPDAKNLGLKSLDSIACRCNSLWLKLLKLKKPSNAITASIENLDNFLFWTHSLNYAMMNKNRLKNDVKMKISERHILHKFTLKVLKPYQKKPFMRFILLPQEDFIKIYSFSKQKHN
ncbi:hypothetical protein BpHYR1_026350 [Brachionus plicatilis]|uniref:Uncharacterized protein n=1 Tax=Brachionus plicatilis TaxID=10195 RepID=A0A3M7P4W5_BRAPC|nr:hypothetical protein BpHYR1_026350 [Brachionus plicatilis]